MDYIGSKAKVNEWMFSHMLADINPANERFFDACAGSGSVSRYAVRVGFGKVFSNDIMEFPSHIVRGSISLPKSKLAKSIRLINKMNGLVGVDGFFYSNYSKDSGRLFFSNENAKKIDACRQFIGTVEDIAIRSYLLYCLLEAMSGVSNCAGIQSAFLKQYKTRALKDMVVKPMPSLHMPRVAKTFNCDMLTLLQSNSADRKKIKETLAYFDPPYNHRQYGPNYHLYETLVKYDDPVLAGKVGLRNWKEESKSSFCSKNDCATFTKNVVDSTVASRVYISYNSDGLLSKNDFMDIFNGYKIELFTMHQKRYKADSSNERIYNETELLEYLFKITK